MTSGVLNAIAVLLHAAGSILLLCICQVFQFVFHNTVEVLVQWWAIKTKSLLYFIHISVVTWSCVISEPLTLSLLRIKFGNCGKMFHSSQRPKLLLHLWMGFSYCWGGGTSTLPALKFRPVTKWTADHPRWVRRERLNWVSSLVPGWRDWGFCARLAALLPSSTSLQTKRKAALSTSQLALWRRRRHTGLASTRQKATSPFCMCAGKLPLTHCWSSPWEGQVPTKLTDTLVSSLNKVV